MPRAELAFAVLLLASCGGGGGSSTPAVQAAPMIQATLISFPTGAVPAGAVSSGMNSGLVVNVLDVATNAAITTATVTFNGTPLAYSASQSAYFVETNVDRGGAVSLTVTLGGTSYTTAGNQVSAYPTITAPSTGMNWSSQASNQITWTGTAPSANSQWVVGVIDPTGKLLWPVGGSFQLLSSGAIQSETVPAGALAPGSEDVLVGVSNLLSISGAAGNSGLVTIGMNYVAITSN